MTKMIAKQIGIIISVLGIAGIIVSQTVHFTKVQMLGAHTYMDVPDPTINNIILFSGIGLLILGVIIFAVGLGGKKK